MSKSYIAMQTLVKSLTLNLCVLSLLTITACTIKPTSVVQQPMTARPVASTPPAKADGAIFNRTSYRPMFEDRKPRFIGDIVTVRITETTQANKSNTSAFSNSGSLSNKVTTADGKKILGLVPVADISASSNSKADDSAKSDASNAFNGLVTATVIEVLANGYLLVSGEKQVSLDKSTEFIRFSGVVNPDHITLGNEVSSTRIADARIEYRTSSKVDLAEITSILSRFFRSVVPF